MIDFQHLGKTLSESGLADKPISQYSKQEVEILVQACINALKPDQKTEYVTKPYLDSNGDLRIQFNSDPKYHWWKCGQSLLETLRELDASEETIRKYVKIEEAPPF